VSFRQRTVLFKAFTSEATKFQTRFSLVRPRTEVALSSVLKVVERPHEDVRVVKERMPPFSFCWTKNHFKHEPAMFRHSYLGLSDRNKTSFARMLEFVGSFSRLEVVAEDGSSVLDSRGNQVTMACFIDTRYLVLSKDPLNLFGRFDLLLFFLCLTHAFY